MVHGWRSIGLLVLAGSACVVGGLLLGRAQRDDAALWHDSGARLVPESRLPTFRTLVEQVGPAVCSVRAMRLESERDDAGNSPAAVDAVAAPVAALADEVAFRDGTGFVIHERGLVLTSLHVVAGHGMVTVHLSGFGALAADVIGQDAATDLALLRLVAPPPGLPTVAFGDSDALRAGDWIVAVSNPLGLARTVTAGLVSFVGRQLRNDALGVSRDALQVSAPINPGSSGGPVFDLEGRVVGVISEIAAKAQGISFAVPSRSVKWALDAMQKSRDGYVQRGYLGIEFRARHDVDEHGQRRPGALIVRVRRGEPADRAGLRAGDIVVGVDGERVVDPAELHERIVCSDPGATIALQLLRDERVCDPIVAVLGSAGQPSATDRPH